MRDAASAAAAACKGYILPYCTACVPLLQRALLKGCSPVASTQPVEVVQCDTGAVFVSNAVMPPQV
jgi:hypothetical protein